VSRKRGSLPRRRSPKPRPASFFYHYTNPKGDAFGKGAQACERAGYNGKRASLAVQASRLLRNNVDIQQAIGRELLMRGCTPGFIADKIMEAMGAFTVRVISRGNGKSMVVKEPNHQIRLKAVELAVRFLSTISVHHSKNPEMRGAAMPADCKQLPKSETAVADSLHLSSSQKIKTVLELIAKDASLTTDEIRARLLRILEAGGDHNDASNDGA